MCADVKLHSERRMAMRCQCQPCQIHQAYQPLGACGPSGWSRIQVEFSIEPADILKALIDIEPGGGVDDVRKQAGLVLTFDRMLHVLDEIRREYGMAGV